MSGINPGLMRRFGGELVQAMQKAAAGPAPAPPKRVHHHLVRPDEGTAVRYEALRAWRTARAVERGDGDAAYDLAVFLLQGGRDADLPRARALLAWAPSAPRVSEGGAEDARALLHALDAEALSG